MKEISIISEQQILNKNFKIYGTFEEPLFLAKDVAEWIGLTNATDMISRVDDDEVTKFNLGGLQGECNFLTENGLYEVLMQSRKPIAKEFKKQVKAILKSLRTGKAKIVGMTDYQRIMSQTKAENARVRKASLLYKLSDTMIQLCQC